MPELSEFEQKLQKVSRACRRCIAALETVDVAVRRRILAWLLSAYAEQDARTGEVVEAK